MKKDTETLRAAYDAWCAASSLRHRRERFKRYTYGDQWSDVIRDSNGNFVNEGDQLIKAGAKPLTNNLIRQLIKSMVGRFRSDSTESKSYSITDSTVAGRNRLAELDSRLFEEFLISGCAIQRIVNERRLAGKGIWIDNVSPRDFFVNTFRDPRSWDIELIGMVHDMSFPKVVNRFAHGDRSVASELRKLYGMSSAARTANSADILGTGSSTDGEFFSTKTGRCRVIEVWTLDSRELLTCHDPMSGRMYELPINEQPGLDASNIERHTNGTPPVNYRWDMGFRWRCRWLAPGGEVLGEMDSPFAHGTHPFVIKFYPLTDGEVHPFVEDVIDQQRYINRLITLIDRMMGASAKGVLLFPTDQLVKGFSWEDVTKRWASCDGVIPITGRSATLPQQVMTSAADSGAYNLLSLELQLFKDVSGVSNALLGKDVNPSTGADLYDNQVKNAAIALADIFGSFASFIHDRDDKIDKSEINW